MRKKSQPFSLVLFLLILPIISSDGHFTITIIYERNTVKVVGFDIEIEAHRGKPLRGFKTAQYHQGEKEVQAAERGKWRLGDKYISPEDWRSIKGGRGL